MSQYQLPVIDITEIPLVALETMNEVHREEVALINQLGELVIAGVEGDADSEAITSKLNEWVEHTRAHFDGENQMMKEYGFPPYPVHLGEHQQALLRIESMQQQWLDDNQLDRLAAYIFVEWQDWFKAHVNSMDMVTARFLSQTI
ncbi:MAG: hemerythrin family protein [Candidatus Thiodiazotropha sp. (ex Codakia rugifera)]|nr:hemerythrin family protein [Candidatus Thiodiazotropha sp. (ex Codakia rugifera)]